MPQTPVQPDASTRERVIRSVLANGPSTARQLAERCQSETRHDEDHQDGQRAERA